ncbi:outer membrane protein [Sphingomonas sp. M1-B02]|uniref:outer membrane protein n=1 Tax=Sphingomonas sp. M1-B02 TaxID=3114300 RepID=UPI002240DB38|nr:outer membrane beta-barrel protein [Sphingomonas sp. S6-11]UZK67681.1 outer membrane beta-barrel protein [Sphingomonas sp. S6-11]
MRTLILATSGLMTLAAPAAYAQEFNGPYFGGSIGYGISKGGDDERIRFDRGFDGSEDVITTTAGTDAFSPGFCGGSATSSANSDCEKDDGGIEFHLRAGYDVQFGNFVVGVVGEFGRSTVQDSVSSFSTTPASYTMTRTIDLEGSVRARLGYVLGEKTLAYVTGGPAYAKIDNRFSTSNTANAFSDNGKSESWGFTAGGGLERSIAEGVSIGVEYLYSRYKDDDYRVRVTRGAANAINPFILFGAPGTEFQREEERFDFHAVRATVAFRF